MKNTNLYKAILATMITATISTSANATVESGTVSFNVLPLITISEERRMVFGEVVKLPNGSTCTLNVAVDRTLTQALSVSDLPAVVTGGAAELLTGDCTVGLVTPEAGIYKVTSFSGALINIELKDFLSPTTVNFEPAGYTVDYVTGAAAYVAIDSSSDVDITVADGAFESATTNGVVAGESILVVGGTFTNQADLTPSLDLVATLEVAVNY